MIRNVLKVRHARGTNTRFFQHCFEYHIGCRFIYTTSIHKVSVILVNWNISCTHCINEYEFGPCMDGLSSIGGISMTGLIKLSHMLTTSKMVGKRKVDKKYLQSLTLCSHLFFSKPTNWQQNKEKPVSNSSRINFVLSALAIVVSESPEAWDLKEKLL